MIGAARPAAPGATRTCPHCKATILDSAAVCPACKHHLRFETAEQAASKQVPLQVEGTLRRPDGDGALEYTMVLAIRNERGEEIARHVVGVGAFYGGEERTFTMSVEAREVVDTRGGRGKRR